MYEITFNLTFKIPLEVSESVAKQKQRLVHKVTEKTREVRTLRTDLFGKFVDLSLNLGVFGEFVHHVDVSKLIPQRFQFRFMFRPNTVLTDQDHQNLFEWFDTRKRKSEVSR
jgi:hypothetical protein